jgi:hypothetical protein
MPARIGMPRAARSDRDREEDQCGQQNTGESQDRGPHNGIRSAARESIKPHVEFLLPLEDLFTSPAHRKCR